MAIHPILVLLPILGFLVLPCESSHSNNGLRIVFNQTVQSPGMCKLSLCPANETCKTALLYGEKNLCLLISCTKNVSCENITNIEDLLAKDSGHMDQNKATEDAFPHQPSSPSQNGSSNVALQSLPTTHISQFADSGNVDQNKATDDALPHQPSSPSQNGSSNVALQLLPIARISQFADSGNVDQNITTGDALPHQPSSPSQNGSSNVTLQSLPTAHISKSNASTPTNPPALKKPSTTVPNKLPTSPSKQGNGSDVPGGVGTTSNSTTTATKNATNVIKNAAQTTDTQQPSTPSPEVETSASISPSVPPATPKPLQSSPVPTSTKPAPTMPKTLANPPIVPPTSPKNIPDGGQDRTDQAKVEVAGDPLSIHLLNTSSLLAVLLFGLLFFVVTVTLFLKQAYESYKRKDYTQVDYLINGMYSDSGV